MKRIIFAVLIAFATITANAQDKNYYGGEKGGFVISYNANPLLNFIGNMFNGTSNNELKDFNGLKNKFFSGNTITAKYMCSDNVALDLGVGFDNDYQTRYAYESESGDNYSKEVGSLTKNSTAFMFKGGINYFFCPGKRLQPVLGVDLVYVHENAFSTTVVKGNTETTTYDSAPCNKLGLMASLGVEYFIIPQISLGATVDIAAGHSWNGSSYNNTTGSTSESGSRVNATETTIITGNVGGNLSLNFYF